MGTVAVGHAEMVFGSCSSVVVVVGCVVVGGGEGAVAHGCCSVEEAESGDFGKEKAEHSAV